MPSSRDTFANFSLPQRSRSERSSFLQRWWSRQQREETTAAADTEELDEVLPYRAVKPKIVQYRVSTNDLDVTSKRPINDQLHPAIPLRTTSLHSHSSSSAWPTHERKAGSIKFDSVPTLTRTPWEAARSVRPSSSRRPRTTERKRNTTRLNLGELPQEIYQCIVDHVESVRSSSEGIDVPGIRHDLRMLCLVDKNWLKVARERLYRDLWLPSNRTPAKRKWSRQHATSKLRLLHDTLRDHPDLAFLVHQIRLSAEVAEEILAQAYTSFGKNSALDLLQEVVQKCYNLERISGNVVPFTVATFPLFNVLATRSRLKEHAWYLNSAMAELPGLTDLIYCHDEWQILHTLVLAADPGVDLGQVAVPAILGRLPSLKHLMVSGLDATDFNNTTLLVLPTLKSLRLESLAGITDRGIEQLAFSRLAPSLRCLKLISLELVSLQTISTLLSHLTRMKKLAVVQKISPKAYTGLASVENGVSFASPSLTWLHWDCLIPGSALSFLAESIEDNRFPRLRQICAPCDYDGRIQALCRPIPCVKMIHDDVEYLESHSHEYERDLRVAQIQAQIRIRESRQQPSFNVIVQDETNEVQISHVIGSYLGDMSSKIEYCLTPEAEKSALASFDDVAWPKRYDASGIERQHDLSLLL